MRFTEELLAATSNLRGGVGRFSDAEMERAYQQNYFHRSVRPVRAALGLAIGLFAGGGATPARLDKPAPRSR